jgi:hypothetical protein
MKSQTLPSFWEVYRLLGPEIRSSARKAYRLWSENPFYPSLHFKCVNREESVWSLRITLAYRALCIFEDGEVTWFWIGLHDEYERALL